MFFPTCQHSISLITASDTVYVKEEVEENLGVDKLIPNCQSKSKKNIPVAKVKTQKA